MSRSICSSIVLGIVFVLSSIAGIRETKAQEVLAPPSDSSGAEVLARGPVHEAFAEPLNLQATDPIVVDRAPPQPVEELPPDVRPEGNNVQWIPGYWAWDDDRRDFLWVSGVWRDCPPGQRWVPGYWSDTDRGFYWSAGFWVSDNAQEVDYLPEPPQTLDQGPTVQAPSDNFIWVPGVWRYLETRYAWQPGYWTAAQPDWMWTPAHYVWSPTGYVFVDGYWDYPLAQRGVLFAPVYYQQPLYQQANYFYTPSTVISTDLLSVHLFSRPRYCHYYFGDYYAPQYQQIGIEPWLMSPRIRGFYDPLFTYYSWSNRRSGRDWNATLRNRYDFFSRNQEYRPAHTYAALQRQRFAPVRGDVTLQNIVGQQTNMVSNFNQYVQNAQRNGQAGGKQASAFRFARLADADRRAYVNEAKEIRSFQQRRTDIEKGNRSGRNTAQAGVDGGAKAGRKTLPLTNLPNATAGQTRRRQGRNLNVALPPNPEKNARTNAGAGGARQTVGKPITDAGRDATGNAERSRLPDSNGVRRDAGLPRGSERPALDPSFNAQPGSAKNLGDGAVDARNRGHGRGTERDALGTSTQGQSDRIGPRLDTPASGNTRTDRGNNVGDLRRSDSDALRSNGMNNRRNFGTQPQVGRQPDQNAPVQDGNRARSRDTFYRGSDGKTTSPRRLDDGTSNRDGRKSVDPFQGRDSRNAPDLGSSGARRIDGNQPPTGRGVDPQTLQGRRQISNQGSGQGNPSQVRRDGSDRTPRGQVGRGSGPASTDARNADRGNTASRAAGNASKSAAQVQRNVPQPKTDDRDRDKRNKDKDGDR